VPGWLTAALDLLKAVLGFLQNRQLEQAGADAQQVKVQEKVNAEVEKAETIVPGSDPALDQQLRSEYDRDTNGQ